MNWRKSYQVAQEPMQTMEMVPLKGAVAVPKEEELRSFQMMVDTVHDGEWIPAPFWEVVEEVKEDRERRLREFEDTYVAERDWGADLVAGHLVQALNAEGFGCPGHHRIRLARVLMDFGRFPGNTPPKAEHLHRFAINFPFSQWLSYRHKKYLLETYYDRISDDFELALGNKHLKLSIHTYDKYNKAGTERPLMSIITRSIGYQTKSTMPQDFFDPLYPSVLSEYTADRKLTYRLSLTLEKAGIPAAHNYPYMLPNGSLEVRSQVWFFFRYLRREFEASFPETKGMRAYQRVWNMLLDTNLRSTSSENLRSYLHMFRRAPMGKEQAMEKAGRAYDAIRSFLSEHPSVLQAYRESPQRPDSIVIEVRKDHVWEFEDQACRIPVGPREANAKQVAALIARGVMAYLRKDRVFQEEIE